MRHILSLVVLLFAVGFTATETAAQVSRVRASGCPNAAYPTPVGSPRIGQGFGVIAPPCRTPNAPQAIMLGSQGPSTVLNRPLTCVDRCILATRPFAVINGSAWRTQIPNNPRLIGYCFRIQTFCIEQPAAGRPCAMLSGAIDVCIQR